MKEFISQNGGVLSLVVMVAITLNFILSGISKGLEVFKDKTATELDNKVYAILNKVASVLQKIIDWSSGNRQHEHGKEPKA